MRRMLTSAYAAARCRVQHEAKRIRESLRFYYRATREQQLTARAAQLAVYRNTTPFSHAQEADFCHAMRQRRLISRKAAHAKIFRAHEEGCLRYRKDRRRCHHATGSLRAGFHLTMTRSAGAQEAARRRFAAA